MIGPRIRNGQIRQVQHRYADNSPRRGKPFVPVPIPALSPTVIESELFGHIRGAFTEARQDKKGRLEFAHSGVPFLDEIGDIDSELQPKLLRFLDSGELYLDYIQHIGRTESLAAAPIETTADSIPRPLRAVVDPVERAHIERTLEFAKGNKRKAIEILEISSDTFYKRLKEFGLY